MVKPALAQLAFLIPNRLLGLGGRNVDQRTVNPLLDANAINRLQHLKLVDGGSKSNKQIHHLRDGAVVLYRRARSKVWQVRFKLFDRKWHCFTTGFIDLDFALMRCGKESLNLLWQNVD